MNTITNVKLKQLSLSVAMTFSASGAIALVATLPAQAFPIIYNPTPTVTMNTGSFSPNFGALVNIANGNGLIGGGNDLQKFHLGSGDANFFSAVLSGGATPADVNFDFNFGRSVFLDTLALWNYNFSNRVATDRGIRDFTLILSNKPDFSKPVYVSPTFILPEGTAIPRPASFFFFPTIKAQYARIDVATNWSATSLNLIGLSEVRFAQSQPVPEPLTLLGVSSAVGFGTLFKRKLHSKNQKG
ncbi:hypothetical protein PCC7424_2180 [Gloeothece citriformis PCC 7424]|uniref:PEP-CTERM protein-sorting domain-containing protein n=1 Tax=Gloeothece citriformis (strain PCC 7424) TaxID=65393 RepID=B7KGD1_GLOC7|nr:PEP-CTERM sorting domain-containing protein [Gloeothece citriformis]ACK70602.1 hypothetical protein PCC7424_2180 [Gloeothece citriformis PCC 7424]